MNYLDKLPLSETLKDEIRAFGADTPGALLGMLRAVPEDMTRLLGSKDKFTEITAALESIIDPSLLDAMAAVPLKSGQLGVQLYPKR